MYPAAIASRTRFGYRVNVAMAVYSNFPVVCPPLFTPSNAIWHPQLPLLAAAGREDGRGGPSGYVHIFSNDGDMLEDLSVQRVSFPQSMAWHPTEKVIAIGWKSGEILVCDLGVNRIYDTPNFHDGEVGVLTWSTTGSLLVSADKKGKIAVWKHKKGAKPSLIQDLKFKGGATKCVFRPNKTEDEAAHLVTSTQENTLAAATMFFVATDLKEVLVCTNGKCTSAVRTGKPIVSLLFDDNRDTLVTLTEDLMLLQNRVNTSSSTGALEPANEAKLSGLKLLSAVWVGDGVLATATNEQHLRVWDLEMMDNYVLSMQSETGDTSGSPRRMPGTSGGGVVSVCYHADTRMLVAATSDGCARFWRHGGAAASDAEAQWQPINTVEVVQGGGGTRLQTVEGIVCGGGAKPFVAVYGAGTLDILREHIMKHAYCNQLSVMQLSSNRAVIEFNEKTSHEVSIPFTMKGICAGNKVVVFWSGKAVCVHQLVRDGESVRQVGDFQCITTSAVVHDDTIYCATEVGVVGYSFAGMEKQQLRLSEREGTVTSLAISGTTLAVGTSAAVLRLWDLERREARPRAMPRSVADVVDGVVDVRVNADGTRVSFLALVDGHPDSSVWVWNVENNTVSSHSFALAKCQPVAHCWDGSEPKLFAVEALPTSVGIEAKKEIVSCFATPDDGIVVQHRYKVGRTDGSLMGMDVPCMYYGRVDEGVAAGVFGRVTDVRAMPDFAGLERNDTDTKAAMIDFSYHLTMGSMDEAFRAVRVIKNSRVWANMARMCVATRRTDVAAYCLGMMGDAAGARALREAEADENEVEARIACLATVLGMPDDAEALYIESERWDLLNRFYQRAGRWTDAIGVAQKHDRAHLRNTCFAYAKYLESCGNLKGAIEYYERSETHHFEVPRALADDPVQLEEYVKASANNQLFKWWAHYLESSKDYDHAMDYYGAAGDILSQVRVQCFVGHVDAARDLVDSSQDASAAYHLARQYESDNNLGEAIKYFSLSGCYTNAIRLAKESGQGNLIYGLAQRSTKRDMVDCARYYEEQPGMADKAVTLYHKGGRVGKALELCFKHSLYQSLADISEDLDQDADPKLLRRAADFFVENRQYDKAVTLLIAGRQFDEALQLCETETVVITEAMAEKMTLDKADPERNALLERVADCCFAQGSYQLATKKYTQASMKVKAMQALLKSGETDKIVFFASRCRQKEIYLMAANYLQLLEWRQDQNMMENIITFYTKAKAFESLSLFYEVCAQVETDDYQNYNKALGALNESLKAISKAKVKDYDEQEHRVSTLQTRISLIKKFLTIRKLADTDGAEMIVQARLLLQMPDVETAVRIGDIYGLMIEYLASQEQYKDAYEVMREMREWNPSVNVVYYVQIETVTAVHAALGIPLGSGRGGDGDDDHDGIEEDLDTMADETTA